MKSQPNDYKLELEGYVTQVTTKKGSGLDREYKIVLVVDQSNALELGQFDLTQRFKFTIGLEG